MDIKSKIGQLMMVGFKTNDLDEIERAVKKHKFGNIILFTRNIEKGKKLAEFCARLTSIIEGETGAKPFIALDQECGMVQRIYDGVTFFPGNMAVGSTGDTQNAYDIGNMLARELGALGINMNLAPCVDINSNPVNPVIGVRSYGNDKAIVSKMGMQMSLGLSDGGIMPCIKHFPGHGDTGTDSHYSAPVIDSGLSELLKRELVPFKYIIDRGAECVMVGHIILSKIDPHTPSTYSARIIDGILRRNLGFKGMVITDCLEMKSISEGIGVGNAAAAAISAGADMLMISHTEAARNNAAETLLRAVETRKLDEARIDESIARITKLKKKYCELSCQTADIGYNRKRSEEISYLSIKKDFGKLFENFDRTLFIGAKNSVNTIAEDENPLKVSLADEFSGEFGIEAVEFDAEEVCADKLVKVSENYEKVVLAISDARLYTEQLSLYRKLVLSGKRVMAISMRTPYDLDGQPKCESHINAYEYTPLSCRSLVKFLKENMAGRDE